MKILCYRGMSCGSILWRALTQYVIQHGMRLMIDVLWGFLLVWLLPRVPSPIPAAVQLHRASVQADISHKKAKQGSGKLERSCNDELGAPGLWCDPTGPWLHFLGLPQSSGSAPTAAEIGSIIARG